MAAYASFIGMTVIFPILFRLKSRFTTRSIFMTVCPVLILCNLITMHTENIFLMICVCFVSGFFRMWGTFECFSNTRLSITPSGNFSVFYPVIYIIVLESIQLSGLVTMHINDWASNAGAQYGALAHSLLNGRLDLEKDPPAAMAELENPYDTAARQAAAPDALWDVAYYNGRYYVYFGIVPCLLFQLPFEALTGIRDLPPALPMILLAWLYILAAFGFVKQAARRWFPQASAAAYLLTAAGADRVLTMDLHASQIQGFFDIPVDNLAGNPIFVDYYAKKYGSECENMMVVSPDVGSVSRARAFAQKLHMNLAIVDKRRQKANSCEVMNVIGDVRDKDCILFDDMVDTGGSLCNAAKALIEVGGAKSVQACASHGVLSGPANERIADSCIKELTFLNTIPPLEGACSKIKYLDVSPIFADAIQRIYEENSMSVLF